MLIIGDYAYPNKEIEFDKAFGFHENILLNCEGYIVEKENSQKGVFNNISSILHFKTLKPVLGLANNHIMDSPDGVKCSIEIAKKNNLLTVGAGKDIDEALQPLIIVDEGIEVAIIAAGWDVIGCKHATASSQGVAPLKENLILPLIRKHKKLGQKVLVYAHWGYELEIYPHPTHRNLAKNFINAGADIVLGCHSHCLQGYEEHNGKYIFFGLGNAIFQENYYYNGGLVFPTFCQTGLSVNWSPKSGAVSVSDIKLSNGKVSLSHFFAPTQHQALTELSKFQSLSENDYIAFFRSNRRKKKLLPIFFEKDSAFIYKFKCLFVIFRATIISVLFKLKLKGSSR